MERLFWQLEGDSRSTGTAFLQRLRATLPATHDDARIIAEIAAQSYEVAATVRNEGSLRYDQICVDLLSGPLEKANAIELAARFDAVEREKAERLTAHYETALARLSPAARSALDAHLDGFVRPHLMWGHDLVGLALKVPDAFLAQRQRVCERRLAKPANAKMWRYMESAETLDISGLTN